MKRKFFFCTPIFIIFFLVSPSIGLAQLYQYEGADGEIILTSQHRKDLKLLKVIDSNPKVEKKASPEARKVANSRAYDERSFDAIIREAANAYQIPVAFIKAVIKIESNFNPHAVSRVGAMGLMQLMPATAEHMGVKDAFDPRENIFGGTRYLRRLADRYNGDINLVLSGYHAGPGNVEKYQGIPFKKTQEYVQNVYRFYQRYREQENNSTSHDTGNN